MSTRWRYPALIMVVCAICLFGRLGATHFFDDDEGYFASTAAEMFRHNDWIVPQFNGDVFGHKPPWMYWMMMSGFTVFGVTEVGARIVQALFGLATALLTYHIGLRLFNRRVGLFAGLVLPSCVMFSVCSRSATPDVFLAFFSTLALYLFAAGGVAAPRQGRAEREAASFRDLLPDRWRVWAGVYAVMGLGVLVKGPIGFLFPMAVIGLFLLCMTPTRSVAPSDSVWTRWREAARPFGPVNFLRTIWTMRPLTAIAMILLVAAPWYVAVGVLTDGVFLREFFGVHHFQRLTTSMEHHSGPVFYYVLAVLIGIFPWSSFAIPMLWEWVVQLRQRDSRFAALTFVSCWAGVYIGLFSVAQTKLPNYVLPAYPAVALICGIFFDEVISRTQARHLLGLRAGFAVMMIVGSVILIGLPISGMWEVGGATLLDRFEVNRAVQSDVVRLAAVGIPLVIGGIAGAWFLRRQKLSLAVTTTAIVAAAMISTLWLAAAPQISAHQSHQSLARTFQTHAGELHNPEIATLRVFHPSMVFYAGQDVRRCVNAEEASELIRNSQAAYVMTDERGIAELREHAPSFEIIDSRPRFPKSGEVHLLRRAATVASDPDQSVYR